MSRMMIVAVVLSLAAATQVFAQERQGSGQGDRPPPRGEGANGEMETLTDAQIAQVKTILSGYNADTLTADQAKAIHEAFRQAGIRGGPALNDAVKAAGFDPDKLRDLAPPPNREGGGSQGGGDRRGPRGQESRGQGQPEENQ